MPQFNTNQFKQLSDEMRSVGRSTFDLSREWKHDFNLGEYVPVLMIPTLPNDEVEIWSEFFFKFDPLYYPIFHRLKMQCDYFYFTNRAMWPATIGDLDTGWTNWIQLLNTVEHPTVDVDMTLYTSSTTSNDSIYGYLGVPYQVTYSDPNRTSIITGLNAFPAAMYLHIWDEYYRNPRLEVPRAVPLVAGDNTAALVAAFGQITPTNVRLKALAAKWDLDYFTSALPQPQVGDAVKVPLLTDGAKQATILRELDGSPAVSNNALGTDASGRVIGDVSPGELYADIDTNAPDIRQLRIAEVMQRFRERMMKIGQRYSDYIKGWFGVNPQPMEIQVPVLFGSYGAIVQISETMSQANTQVGESNFYTGDYSGNASLYGEGNRSLRFFSPDHGLIMAIMNIMPNTGYSQGIERYWRYSSPYDYPLDIFCTIGDQEIKKSEVMYTNYTPDASRNDETFGYTGRYDEARYANNSYGSNLMNELGLGLSMHLGRWWDPESTTGADYDQRVELDDFFVNALGDEVAGNIREADIFKALTALNGSIAAKPVVGYIYHRIAATRPLPYRSIPSL